MAGPSFRGSILKLLPYGTERSWHTLAVLPALADPSPKARLQPYFSLLPRIKGSLLNSPLRAVSAILDGSYRRSRKRLPTRGSNPTSPFSRA